jgi:spermidine synthase
LQINRFYTLEFFHLVHDLLSEDGILVIKSPSSLSYMSDELRDLNQMVHSTLKQVYPHVRPIPGETTLWIASLGNEVNTMSVEDLIQKWEERKIDSQLLSEPYFLIRLDQLQLNWFWEALDTEDNFRGSITNTDLHPVGLFYGLSYWHALFSPELRPLFTSIERLDVWVVSFLIIVISLLAYAIAKLTNRGRRAQIATVIATTGFIGMTADLVLIFAFQSLYGYVYHWIGLFITMFMAGMGLGGYLMTRRLDRITDQKRIMLVLELSILTYCMVLPILLLVLFSGDVNAIMLSISQAVLLLLNAVAGFLVGSQFPLANKMLLREGEVNKGSVGFLYASDLFGAFLGAIIVSVVLIPVLGIINTCLLVALLKLGSLLLSSALPGPIQEIYPV